MLDHLFVNPYMTATRAAELLQVSHPTALKAIKYLMKAQILKPISVERWRRRRYAAGEILGALELNRAGA